MVDREGYQTPTGFTTRAGGDDIRSVVDRVEPAVGRPARAGLEPGDRIVAVNGRPNSGVLTIVGEDEPLDAAAALAREQGATVEEDRRAGDRRVKVYIDDPTGFDAVRVKVKGKLVFAPAHVFESDVFSDLIGNWPRGDQSLDLDIRSGRADGHVGPFVPRTLGLHPTQVYETISMLLLVFLLLAFYPFRRHDGQVMTLFIACYAIHRFLDETLRNDTDIVGLPNMTLSQNISILMFLLAVALEVGHRRWGTRRADAAPPAPA